MFTNRNRQSDRQTGSLDGYIRAREREIGDGGEREILRLRERGGREKGRGGRGRERGREKGRERGREREGERGGRERGKEREGEREALYTYRHE